MGKTTEEFIDMIEYLDDRMNTVINPSQDKDGEEIEGYTPAPLSEIVEDQDSLLRLSQLYVSELKGHIIRQQLQINDNFKKEKEFHERSEEMRRLLIIEEYPRPLIDAFKFPVYPSKSISDGPTLKSHQGRCAFPIKNEETENTIWYELLQSPYGLYVIIHKEKPEFNSENGLESKETAVAQVFIDYCTGGLDDKDQLKVHIWNDTSDHDDESSHTLLVLDDIQQAKVQNEEEEVIKVVVATHDTQGQRDNDFCSATDGEIVIPPLFFCSGSIGRIDGHCGCRRSLDGITSYQQTTTAKVIAYTGTKDDLATAITQYINKRGETIVPGKVEKIIYNLSKGIASLEIGTIVEYRGDQYIARSLDPA